MAIKDNVHAFRVANKTYKLVKEFKKTFLSTLADESLDNQLKMWSMCIRYMQEELQRRLK